MSTRPSFALSVLRLCRIGTWFSPAADVLASSAIVGIAFGAPVVQAMLASMLIYGAGMVWNDIADQKEDARQRPERPLPSGAVSLAVAIGLGTLLLGGGLLLSPCIAYHGWIAGLVLFYDFVAKRSAVLSALTMGTLRGLNLGIGFALLTALAPLTSPELASERHALLVASLCYGVYIVAVTFLGMFEDSKTVTGRAVATVQSAPPLLALAGIGVVQGGFWPATAIAALPALWFLRRNSRMKEWPQGEIRRSMMFLLLGTMLYTALLAFAAGRPIEAAAIAAAILPARWIARRIALT
ncbi:MAG: UbiA family prenyltransferase [Planctomycetota bacterium]